MLLNIGRGLIRATSKIYVLVQGHFSPAEGDTHTINSSGDRLIITYKE